MDELLDFRRGDVLWVDCDPSIGVEPKKIRTCVVISNDMANEHASTVTVVPTLKYTAARVERPYMIDLRRPRSNLEKPRVANASVVMTYDRRRVQSRVGRVYADAMREIDLALAIHLGLEQP